MKANRSLFKKYLRQNNQKVKHDIEKAFVDDDFVMEALEGFQSDQTAWANFEVFDKRSQKKQRQIRLLIGTTLLIGALFIGDRLIPQQSTARTSKHRSQLQKNAGIKIHKQPEIQKMQPVAVQQRILPTQVRIETQAKDQHANNLIEAIDRMEQMPIQPIALNKDAKKGLTLKLGRELYIKNFKVVDYRYYRKEESKQARGIAENEYGEEVLRIPYINLLSNAIEEFSKENYKLALLHFDQILEVYPDDANALFYGGMCLYNLNQLNQAESRFLKLQNISFANFSEEGNWYLLHVYKRTKKEAAFSSLRSLIAEQKGFYAPKAALLTFD